MWFGFGEYFHFSHLSLFLIMVSLLPPIRTTLNTQVSEINVVPTSYNILPHKPIQDNVPFFFTSSESVKNQLLPH